MERIERRLFRTWAAVFVPHAEQPNSLDCCLFEAQTLPATPEGHKEASELCAESWHVDTRDGYSIFPAIL